MLKLLQCFLLVYLIWKCIFVGPPSRPQGPLLVKELNKDSAVLKWNPPKDTGGDDLGYVLIGNNILLYSAISL